MSLASALLVVAGLEIKEDKASPCSLAYGTDKSAADDGMNPTDHKLHGWSRRLLQFGDLG